MEYLYQGNWFYGSETTSEVEAVRRSRSVWKSPGVAGVRVLRTETTIHKTATK